MTLVLASLVTATAALGAWTLAILKVKRQADAAAIRRRLARGQDPRHGGETSVKVWHY